MIAQSPTLVAALASARQEDVVLASALQLAADTGSALHLVHALPGPGETVRAAVQTAEDELRARVGALAPRARVEVHAAAGPPSRVISNEAERCGAGLLLVGASREARFARALLGTTPARVLRAAHAPLLVLRTALARPLRRVLLANDLSGGSARAHELGLDVVDAVALGTAPTLRSLHVVWGGDAPVRGCSCAGDESGVRTELTAFLADRRPRGAPVEAALRAGDPAREIAAEAAAWDADLVVVGTHGRTGAARFLLGSVAESVLRLAPCNVLVVPSAP